jgi:hypothetical protein
VTLAEEERRHLLDLYNQAALDVAMVVVAQKRFEAAQRKSKKSKAVYNAERERLGVV